MLPTVTKRIAKKYFFYFSCNPKLTSHVSTEQALIYPLQYDFLSFECDMVIRCESLRDCLLYTSRCV